MHKDISRRLKLQVCNLIWIYSYLIAIKLPTPQCTTTRISHHYKLFLSTPQAIIWGWCIAMKQWVTTKLINFKVKLPRIRPHCTQNVLKYSYTVNPWPTSWMSQVVIFSKAAACTRHPVAFNEYQSTRGCLTGLRYKPQKKQTSQLLAAVLW